VNLNEDIEFMLHTASVHCAGIASSNSRNPINQENEKVDDGTRDAVTSKVCAETDHMFCTASDQRIATQNAIHQADRATVSKRSTLRGAVRNYSPEITRSNISETGYEMSSAVFTLGQSMFTRLH
jgi:hypothetical protein